MHMMGAGFGFFFGFLWLLVMLGFFISWFLLVYAVWRSMKTNEKMLEVLSEMTRALQEAHSAPKNAGAEPAETVEKPEEQKEVNEKTAE